MPPNKLVSMTLYQGAVGPSLIRDFPFFANTKWILKHAAVHTPINTHNYLRSVKQTIEELVGESKNPDSEFAFFADHLWIFGVAAADHPSNPRKYLRDVKKAAKPLIKESKNPDSEFAFFADKPSKILQAFIQYPSNPQKFLRNRFHDNCSCSKSNPESPVFGLAGSSRSLEHKLGD